MFGRPCFLTIVAISLNSVIHFPAVHWHLARSFYTQSNFVTTNLPTTMVISLLMTMLSFFLRDNTNMTSLPRILGQNTHLLYPVNH